MTPQRRKVLTALSHGKRRMVSGSVVALLAASLGAVSAPAYAGTQANFDEPAASVAGGGGDHPKPPKPPTPPVDAECHSVDSWVAGERQFYGVVEDEEIFVGVRSVGGDPGEVEWEEITTLDGDTLRRACDITITTQGDDAFITVITTSGQVYETICDIIQGEPALECEGEWELLDPQPED